MAITSTITTNVTTNTVTMSVFLNGTSLLDTFTYDQTLNTISFPVRSPQTISSKDFITNLGLFISFNGIIKSSGIYSSQQTLVPVPNTTITVTDDGISQLIWTYQPGNHPLFNFTCTYPNGTVTLGNRNQANSIGFAEWLYLINNLVYLQSMVGANYKQ